MGASEDGGLYDKAIFGDREPILLRQVSLAGFFLRSVPDVLLLCLSSLGPGCYYHLMIGRLAEASVAQISNPNWHCITGLNKADRKCATDTIGPRRMVCRDVQAHAGQGWRNSLRM